MHFFSELFILQNYCFLISKHKHGYRYVCEGLIYGSDSTVNELFDLRSLKIKKNILKTEKSLHLSMKI